jgi:hypothetical protein
VIEREFDGIGNGKPKHCKLLVIEYPVAFVLSPYALTISPTHSFVLVPKEPALSAIPFKALVVGSSPTQPTLSNHSVDPINTG